jgi:hypothetical protein
MLTYKRVLAFLFLAAFAEEEARALRWALTLIIEVGTEPALQGLSYSAIAVAANAALIWGALRLLRAWRHSRRGTPVQIEPPPLAGLRRPQPNQPCPSTPSVREGPSRPAGRKEGGSDEQRPERP